MTPEQYREKQRARPDNTPRKRAKKQRVLRMLKQHRRAAKRKKAARTLVLWGVHPSHGNVPLKIAEWSAAEQRRREAEGWTCAAYAAGDDPVGLAETFPAPF